VISEAIKIAKETLVKPFEGCAKVLPDKMVKAYPDPGTKGHPWTIGYGSTGPNVNQDTVWTMAQCEQELDHHLTYFATNILKMSPSLLKATPSQLAAVISWAYNCGLGNYRISTFKKRIDAGNWVGAREECVKWNKAAGRVLPGLTRRRLAEASML